MGRKPLIDECLHLLTKLEAEFPDEPDLEALHSVSGIYAQLKADRDRFNDFPIQVRRFCELIHASGCAREEAAKYLAMLLNSPGVYSSATAETFLEKRKRIADIALRAGLDSSGTYRFLSMAKLKGILDEKGVLAEEYRRLIAEYLGFQA